jgi:hypothetical protein
MDWIDLAQEGDQWRVLVNLWLPKNSEKFLSNCATGGLSIRTQLREVT